jgi:hypothetical protein
VNRQELERLGPVEVVFMILVAVFLASFLEAGLIAGTNMVQSGEMIVAAQMIASILLMMLVGAILIMRDITKKI